MQQEERKDIYAQVTQRILDQMEKGVKPWEQPWNADGMDGRIILPRRHTGEAYRGINIVVLWCEALDKSYSLPTWMTFKQALEMGGNVRKGEKSTPIVWSKPLSRDVEGEDGEAFEVRFYAPRFYQVFNVQQIEKLPDAFYAKQQALTSPVERIERVESFVTHTGAHVRTTVNKAFYALAPDYIGIPPIEAFRNAESYYRTLFHELGHWTRHPDRLGRDLGKKKWGDQGYAREEMVAELAAAFLSADMALPATAEDQHAAYLSNWQHALKEDKRFIFTAAALAQQAATFLHGLQPSGISASVPHLQSADELRPLVA